MKPYPKYKPSGIEWIGNIPEPWAVKKLKYITFNYDGKRIPLSSEERSLKQGNYPYYGANGIIDYIDNYIFDGEYILVGEDGAPFFLFGKDVAFFVSGKFWVNNHAHILKAKKNYSPKYLTYLLNCVDYREYISGSTRDKLTQFELSSISLLSLSIEEQTQITAYLDSKTEKIDKLITNKQKQTELLKAERQVLINKAVTGTLFVPKDSKGIEFYKTGESKKTYKEEDFSSGGNASTISQSSISSTLSSSSSTSSTSSSSSSKLKSASIPNIASVPNKWQLKKLKYITLINYGLSVPPPTAITGTPLIRATNIKAGSILETDMLYVDPNQLKTSKNITLKTGDIIVVRSGAYTTDSSIIPPEYNNSIAGYDLIVRPKKINSKFLAYALLSNYIKEVQLLPLSLRAAQPHINAEELGNTLIIFPSTINEQETIIDLLEIELSEIDRIIEKINSEIKLLNEFKTSLISEVVTGKKDVRDFQIQ